MYINKKLLLTIIFLCSALCSETPDIGKGTRSITISDISREPIKKIRRFQPLANYLAENLAEFNISEGKVKIAPDMETLVRWIENNEVDIYIDSVYPSVQLIEKTNSIPILRRWKNTLEEYYSVFFVLNSSSINSLEDLKGKTLALENEYSTTGFMMPVWEILKLDLKLNKVNSCDESEIKADYINYLFAKEDNNIIQWVIKGKTDAGVIDNYSFNKIPPSSQEYLKKIAVSPPITRQLVVARKNLEPEIIIKIQQLLLNLDNSKEGRLILDNLKDTKKFDLINMEMTEKIREIKQLIPVFENLK